MNQNENKMAVMPIRRLLIHMSWPPMLSMLIQALYNMVDSIFVAQINEAAFIALSLCFPVQTLMTAIQAGTGIGVNAMISRRLGENRPEEAGVMAVNGVFLYLMSWLSFLAFGLFLSRPFMMLYSKDPVVIEYGVQYLTIVTAMSLGSCMQFTGERILQATGNAIGPMLIQGIGAIVNLILDPIMIFGLFGFPRLEVAGAAMATGLGQIVGMGIALVLVSRNRVIKLPIRGFRPSGPVVQEIYHIGMPAIAMQSLFTLMTLGMNKILDLFTDTGVFIMGAYFKIQSFIFMPVFGLNNGLTPVVSFNYGAKNKTRVVGLIRFAVAIAAAVMLGGILIFQLFPHVLLSFFDADQATLDAGVRVLRILSLSFLPCGITLVLCTAFQALGSAMLSFGLSIIRQVVILMPLTMALGLLAGPDMLWWSFCISESIGFVAALVLYRWIYRTKIADLDRLPTPEEKE